MSISEIKELTKYLTEEEVEKIKQEIKDKETTLKGGNLDEEEMVQVLNTLFAVLVIEKALESEMEGIEEIRDELEAELMECYEVYDTYMAKFRKEDKKKKKKNWLLAFLGLSENIAKKKQDIGASNKALSNMQKELNALKQQKSNEYLKDVIENREKGSVEKYSECVHGCKHPRDFCPTEVTHKIEGRGFDRNGYKGPRRRRSHHEDYHGGYNNERERNLKKAEYISEMDDKQAKQQGELSSINRGRG